MAVSVIFSRLRCCIMKPLVAMEVSICGLTVQLQLIQLSLLAPLHVTAAVLFIFDYGCSGRINWSSVVAALAVSVSCAIGGSVACLEWFGQGLAELWQTSHIEGYVADYYFDDAGAIDPQNDTVLNRLYVAQIPAATLFEQLMPGSESKILAYEMVVKKTPSSAKDQ